MRLSVLKTNGRSLARGCAILMVAGAAAGCSSQMSRFNGVDDVMTGATPNQRSIINKQQPAAQPYPGDVDVAPAPAADGGYRQSVTRSSLQPVSVQQSASTLPPPAAAQPVRTASAQLDRTPTGTIAPAVPAGAPFKYNQPDPAKAAAETRHAQAQGGKLVVTAQEGDSIYGLARRFNVSSSELMQANNLTAEKGLKVGQKVVIPGYKTVEGNTRVADARPQAPADRKAPAAPAEKVAVLPQQPKLKEGKAVAQLDGATANNQPKPREAKVASAAVAGAGGSYTVQQGDTLSAISRKTGVGVSAIKQANGMQDGILRIGQTLKIPAAGAAPAPATTVAAAKPSPDPVVTGSTGQPKKATETLTAYAPPKKDASVIQQAEDDDVAAPGATGIGKMRWPVRGRVISAFGSGSDGVDIAVPEGTPIKAAENGVVIYAGDGLKEFGNTVLVRHEDGLVTVYGHASSLEVQRGQKVKRGQEIARSGMSGTTDSPKLHFEVRKNSAPVNPSTYLE